MGFFEYFHSVMRLYALALCLFFVSVSEAKTIKSASDLIKWFNIKTSVQEPVELGADIDFTKTSLKYPLGVSLENGECTPFSGILNGNGYSIKGLKMDNNGDSLYSSAGLFCSLKEANISNLVIEESCEFKGVTAGAFSAKASRVGAVSFNHVTNKANVTGSQGSGGFIGNVERKVSSEINFQHCSNEGKVTSKGNNTGGFIGCVSYSYEAMVTFLETTNDGVISGGENVGGFVGGAFYCQRSEIEFSQSSNEKAVSGTNYVAGFVGFSAITTTYSPLTVMIRDGINRGDIQAKEIACGFYCLTLEYQYHPQSKIFNVINHGSVTGNLAFGITVRPTNAMNVINVGQVTGNNLWSLWDIIATPDNAFSLNSTCYNCKSATRIDYNSVDGMYYVSGTKMHVDDMLNWNVMNNHNWKYNQLWGKKLEFLKREGELSIANRITGSFTVFFTLFIILFQMFIMP